MNPQYSILIYNYPLDKTSDYISRWLKNGIKVIVFGNADDVVRLNSSFKDFERVHLLLTYVIDNDELKKFTVADGDDPKNHLSYLEMKYPEFNAAQYRAEHCCPDNNIIVEASAGTGKTTVMIDRIMFLMHTVPGIKLSDIAMITFTNEAANQMSLRLQKVLRDRFELTGKNMYLKWMEEQGSMQISTIDSFSFMLMKLCGVSKGFSRDLTIKTLNYERKEIIKNELDSIFTKGTKVVSQLGVSYYDAYRLIDRFWKKASELGVDTDYLLSMDWGECDSSDGKRFQKMIIKVCNMLKSDYQEEKRLKDAVTLADLKRDLNSALTESISKNIISHMSFRYLFIDEFQDSDNAQIDVICKLVSAFELRLFAVGDIKQSIYRFRGAADSAFERLKNTLKINGTPVDTEINLVNNYRTSCNVLDEFNRYFSDWAIREVLSYSAPVKGCNTSEGNVKFTENFSKYFDEEIFIREVNEAFDEFNSRISEKTITDSDRVTVLTRTNRQLLQISDICEKYKIPAIIRKEGTFFISDAVRDFFAFLQSFIYPDEPAYMFNYLLSPYSEFNGIIDIYKLESADGIKDNIAQELKKYLSETNWDYYYEQFRTRPVLSVINEVLTSVDAVSAYASIRMNKKTEDGWNNDSAKMSVQNEASQYVKNTEKLMEILLQRFAGESVSLPAVCEFLKLSIATNREESEPETDIADGYKSLNCMTVHKSKGLEFDTVILPFTDLPFYFGNVTEILLSNDMKKVGWHVGRGFSSDLRNNNYNSIRYEENINATAEEMRILYVAMTRTIRSFRCIIGSNNNDNTWTGMLRKVFDN